jgi:hypothetical protein
LLFSRAPIERIPRQALVRALRPNYVLKPTAGDMLVSTRPPLASGGFTRR